MADETQEDSLRLAATKLVLLRNDSLREVPTTSIPLIEICNKFLFVIV